MTPDQVHEALRSGVDGHLPSMAAVELLIAHGSSIGRLQTAGLIEWSDPEHRPPMAWIDWHGLDDQLARRTDPHGAIVGASRSGHNILRIAASLTTDHQIGLNDVLQGLDSTNTALVTQAVIDAYGHGSRIRVDVQPRRDTAIERALDTTRHQGPRRST